MRKTVDRILPSKELGARLIGSYLSCIQENHRMIDKPSTHVTIIYVVTLIICVGVLIKII